MSFHCPINTEELRCIYGNASSNRGEHGVVARSGIVYDVLNQLVLDRKLHPYLTSERSVIMELLDLFGKWFAWIIPTKVSMLSHASCSDASFSSMT